MKASATGRTIYPKIGIWYRADKNQIHFSIEGQGFSTVNGNPKSIRGNPHLFAKLAKVLRDAGAEHPQIVDADDTDD